MLAPLIWLAHAFPGVFWLGCLKVVVVVEMQPPWFC